MKIFATLGSKGGTGKSSIAYAMVYYLVNQKKQKCIVINTDESSVTIDTFIRKGSLEKKVTIINIEINQVFAFLHQNKLFVRGFDVCVIDTKGEDVSEETLAALGTIVDAFVMPFTPATASIIPTYNSLDKGLALFGDLKKYHIIYNHVATTKDSLFFKNVKAEIESRYKSKHLNIHPGFINVVKNMDDKKAKTVSLMSNKHNKATLHEFFYGVLSKSTKGESKSTAPQSVFGKYFSK